MNNDYEIARKFPSGEYELMMTPTEFAESTGLALRTVQKWAQTGRIEAVKLKGCGCWLIPKSEANRIAKELEEFWE